MRLDGVGSRHPAYTPLACYPDQTMEQAQKHLTRREYVLLCYGPDTCPIHGTKAAEEKAKQPEVKVATW